MNVSRQPDLFREQPVPVRDPGRTGLAASRRSGAAPVPQHESARAWRISPGGQSALHAAFRAAAKGANRADYDRGARRPGRPRAMRLRDRGLGQTSAGGDRRDVRHSARRLGDDVPAEQRDDWVRRIRSTAAAQTITRTSNARGWNFSSTSTSSARTAAKTRATTWPVRSPMARLSASPCPPFELLSYFALLIIASNETTRDASTADCMPSSAIPINSNT